MSGARGSAGYGKVKVMVRVRLRRPYNKDRFFTTFIFINIGFTIEDLKKRVASKYFDTFSDGVVSVMKYGYRGFYEWYN